MDIILIQHHQFHMLAIALATQEQTDRRLLNSNEFDKMASRQLLRQCRHYLLIWIDASCL